MKRNELIREEFKKLTYLLQTQLSAIAKVQNDNVVALTDMVKSIDAKLPGKRAANRKLIVVYKDGDVEMELARFLYGKAMDVRQIAEPNWQRWCEVFDFMIRVAGITPEAIRNKINDAMASAWWREKIKSPSLLKKHFNHIKGRT